MSIKVIIAGFKGKWAKLPIKMVTEIPELELVGLLDPFDEKKWLVFCLQCQEELLTIYVQVDFTTPKVVYDNTHFALEQGFLPKVVERQALIGVERVNHTV